MQVPSVRGLGGKGKRVDYGASAWKGCLFSPSLWYARSLRPVFGYKHTKGVLFTESLPEITRFLSPSVVPKRFVFPHIIAPCRFALGVAFFCGFIAAFIPLFAHNWTFGREENSESANSASIFTLHPFTRCLNVDVALEVPWITFAPWNTCVLASQRALNFIVTLTFVSFNLTILSL